MNQREYLAHVQNLCVNLDGNFLLYMEENQGYLYALNKYSGSKFTFVVIIGYT